MGKKVIVISGLILVIIGSYLWGNSRKIQNKVNYGDDISVIAKRFEQINGIQKCYYQTTLIGNVSFGPSNYRIEAVILVNEVYSKEIEKWYDGEEVELKVEEVFWTNLAVEEPISWQYNQLFEEEILNHKFVGKVYFSSDAKLIYLLVENL
jgi:hypothetical protein